LLWNSPSGCGKEVPLEIDTTEEKRISTVIKEGTIYEACALLRENDDRCYACHAHEGEFHSKGCPVRLYGSQEKMVLYKHALTATEVNKLYNEDTKTACIEPDPVAWIPDLSMEKLKKTAAFLKIVEQMAKTIDSPAYIVDYDKNEVRRLDPLEIYKEPIPLPLPTKPLFKGSMAGEPGTKLIVRRLDLMEVYKKPLALPLPTEPLLKDGEVPLPEHGAKWREEDK